MNIFSTFKNDIITQAATQGGGLFGNCLIAPNTAEQLASIAAMLLLITNLPFFQVILIYY